jgi:hypothetical protein
MCILSGDTEIPKVFSRNITGGDVSRLFVDSGGSKERCTYITLTRKNNKCNNLSKATMISKVIVTIM